MVMADSLDLGHGKNQKKMTKKKRKKYFFDSLCCGCLCCGFLCCGFLCCGSLLCGRLHHGPLHRGYLCRCCQHRHHHQKTISFYSALSRINVLYNKDSILTKGIRYFSEKDDGQPFAELFLLFSQSFELFYQFFTIGLQVSSSSSSSSSSQEKQSPVLAQTELISVLHNKKSVQTKGIRQSSVKDDGQPFSN